MRIAKTCRATVNGGCWLAAISIAASSLGGPALAQWKSINPPANSAILHHESSAGSLLITRNTGSDPMFVSADSGVTWHTRSLPRPGLLRLLTRPTVDGAKAVNTDLYSVFLTGGGWFQNFRCELWKTSDVGKAWTVVNPGSLDCFIALDPSSPEVMYGTGYGESGRWDRVDTHGFAVLETEAPSRRFLFASGLVNNRLGLYRSGDEGTTWRPVTRAHQEIPAFWIGTRPNPGLQGFSVAWLDRTDNADAAELGFRISYIQGMALRRGNKVVSMSRGLPTISALPWPVGGRYALTPAGLSTCADPQSCVGGALPQIATLIEYHNNALNHYFMTNEGPEAVAVDSGAADPGWTPETADAFANGILWMRPSAAGPYENYCALGKALYRLYNGRFAENDSNHRYVTDAAQYEQQRTGGWIDEGVQLCVLR